MDARARSGFAPCAWTVLLAAGFASGVLQGCATVGLQMPEAPLFAGSYARIPVTVGAGVAFDDLEFVVPAGPQAGQVSPSRDASFDPARPELMLLAGYQPGSYRLQVFDTNTSALMLEAPFDVSTTWTDEAAGPSLWIAGVVEKPTGVPGAAWGGGPAGVPQNIDVLSAIGSRQLDIVLVDTASQRYPGDAAAVAAIRDHWLDEAQDASPSAAAFFDEVSYGKFQITASVFGPVQLPGPWEDYFYDTPHSGDPELTIWKPRASFYPACAAAADGLIQFGSGRSLACVTPSLDSGAVFAWPSANGASITTAEGTFNPGTISMPADFELLQSKQVHETLSHELGHNLGLPDLYTPKVPMFNPPTQVRNLDTWDLMGQDAGLPHFSIANRMMLGWIDAAWVEPFNFAANVPNAPPVDRTVTLRPAQLGAPSAGARLAAEVRVANGWNYYFEYRSKQGGQFGDQGLPLDRRIVGTDVLSNSAMPIERPDILLLDNDPDGDGSVLGSGQNYREPDVSDPFYPTDFRADAGPIAAGSAQLRVRYGTSSRPDPYIRPWPASPEAQWQSPDIEVMNARNAADPAWKNVPWIGHTNTVVATVHNGGTLNAEQVKVEFFAKPFNIGFDAEFPIGSDVEDIPVNGSTQFESTWVPPFGGHWCIKVRIAPYQTATGVKETSEKNNLAQSNYTKFISATASAPSRETAILQVQNPFAQRTRVLIQPSQTNPFYRTYLEHRWLTLDPGEIRKIEVMFEFAPDAAPPGPVAPHPGDARRPNDVQFVSFIEDPRDDPPHHARLYSGAQVQVVTGRATRFESFATSDRAAAGRVVTVDNGQPPPGGQAILAIGKVAGDMQYRIVPVVDGSFSGALPDDWWTVTGHYVPMEGYDESRSETIGR